MSKRYALIIAFVLTIGSLTGCGSDKPEKVVESEVSTSTEQSGSDNQTTTNDDNTETDKQSTEEVNYDDIVYEKLGEISEGLCYFVYNGKYGYIDKDENVVIEPIFERAYNFNGSLAIIMENELEGLINKEGEIVVEPIYSMLYTESDEDYNDIFYKTGIYKDKKRLYGILDLEGNVILEPIYDLINYSDGMLRIKKDEMYAYSDINGNFITDFIYDWKSEEFSDGLAFVSNGEKVGAINKKGEVVIPFKYDKPEEDFVGGQAVVSNYGESLMLIDKEGNELHKFEGYDIVRINNINGEFTYSAGTYESGTYSLLDNKFKLIVDTDYELIMKSVYGDFLAISYNDKEGAMTPEGKIIIPPEYYGFKSLSDDLLAAHMKSYTYHDIYDLEGNFIKQVPVKNIYKIDDTTLYKAKTTDGKYGIMDENFEYVIEPIYDTMYMNYELGKGAVTVEQDGVWKLTTIDY